MKNHLKFLRLIPALNLFLFLLLFSNSHAQTLSLTSADQAKSQQFQSQKGNDRLTTYNDLQHLIVSEAALVYANGTGSTTLTTSSDVVTIFGQPDFQLTPTIVGYYLKRNNTSCLVIFGFNANNQVQYATIKDCN